MAQSNELADRFNTGKVEWSLVDFKSLESLVRVLMYGKQKYAAHNWKKGLIVTEVCDSLMRHLIAFLDGEDKDEESGLEHVGHMMANVMFLSHMMKNKPELDNRYKNKDEINSSE